jgi:hypothetical protein
MLVAMTDRRRLVSERAALGLAIAAFGCTPDPGFEDEGETGGNDDPTGEDEVDDDATDTETDTGPNDIPFEVKLAVFNATGKFVALRFSEPVAPIDGVDPRDFRISLAQPIYSCNYDACYTQTTYWDVNFYADHYAGYEPYSDARLETDLIALGNMPTDIVLRFETEVDPIICDFFPGEGDLDVLFVHYSPGEVPVRSADGEVLAPIGPEWVEVAPNYVWGVYGEFPNLNPQIAIPCNL